MFPHDRRCRDTERGCSAGIQHSPQEQLSSPRCCRTARCASTRLGLAHSRRAEVRPNTLTGEEDEQEEVEEAAEEATTGFHSSGTGNNPCYSLICWSISEIREDCCHFLCNSVPVFARALKFGPIFFTCQHEENNIGPNTLGQS